MPLALDDAALARVCIACTAIPSNERGKWLERFARKLDPRARPSTRQARWHDRTPTHGYEPMREAPMTAFAKEWRREWGHVGFWAPRKCDRSVSPSSVFTT
jgi:hypothetical protein